MSVSPNWLTDNWAPTRNGIYFMDDRTGVTSLNVLNLSTRRVQKVADLPGRLARWGASPSLSADSRTLIVTLNDQMSGDIMLVESFH